MIDIDVIDTASLGDRGYLASDGSVALVVDPQRDFARVLALAHQRGVTIAGVFETHIHNDYVTGGLALAREVGAAYYLAAADQVSFDRTPVAEGDQIQIGNMMIEALATPGHTFTHLAYALAHEGQVAAVFTGGSLLNGSTGRTDLLGAEHSVELARSQYRSAHRLATELPADAIVYPTHGFGSFCSATPTAGMSSTIGAELLVNPALTLDEAGYVESTLAALDAYPAYYAHMAPANAAGPMAPDLSPPKQASAGELRAWIEAGEWVVDLRSRIAFAAGHLPGALQFELGDQLATYLGWLIPWGTPLTLIGATPADVAAAQLELVRIGIERVKAAAIGEPDVWAAGSPLACYPVLNFAAFARAREQRREDAGSGSVDLVLLDVRRDLEWKDARIPGAVHIPLHELSGRIAEVPDGEVWVHCHGGYRASIAASLLDAAGRNVVLINEDFSVAERDGLATA